MDDIPVQKHRRSHDFAHCFPHIGTTRVCFRVAARRSVKAVDRPPPYFSRRVFCRRPSRSRGLPPFASRGALGAAIAHAQEHVARVQTVSRTREGRVAGAKLGKLMALAEG